MENKKIITTIFLALLTASAEAISCTSIEQYGITWTFDQEYECGQFVNEDWWIVGPVSITSIDPAWQSVNGRMTNGSMVNPTNAAIQGYDAAAPWYSESANAGIGISQLTPLELSPNTSIVSSIGLVTPTNHSQVKSAAILTILNSAPPDTSPATGESQYFRPSYAGDDKTLLFKKEDLDYTKLGRARYSGEMPTLAYLEREFKRPLIDHPPIPHSQKIRPNDNFGGDGTGTNGANAVYGREIATDNLNAALVLNLDFTNQEKELLLTRYVQYGIDLFGIMQSGGGDGWHGDGGHGGGRKIPIMLAAAVLDYQPMFDAMQKTGEYLYEVDGYGPGDRPLDYKDFGEDAQTFYISEFDVFVTHNWVPSSGGGKHPDNRDCTNYGYPADASCPNWAPYEEENIGQPEWGIGHSHVPYQSNLWWPANYRDLASSTFPGQALAIYLMGVKEEWNNDAFFDYTDWYMYMIREDGPYEEWNDFTNANAPSAFVQYLWQQIRPEYYCVYTGLAGNERQYDCSQCIYNCPNQECQGTDTSCGETGQCQNCNQQDGCEGNSYRDYSCQGAECIYIEDDCRDCSCNCAGYGNMESIANGNCSDGKDNDCDGQTDSQDQGCEAPEYDVFITFESGNGGTWDDYNPGQGTPDWQISDDSTSGGTNALRLGGNVGIVGTQDRLGAYRILQGTTAEDFTLEARVRSDATSAWRDLGIIFSFQEDSDHCIAIFNRSCNQDTEAIFLVETGQKKAKISNETCTCEDGCGSLADNAWHKVKIIKQGNSIEAYFDDMQDPVFTTITAECGTGSFGFGSINDTGLIDDIRISIGQECVNMTTLTSYLAQWKMGNTSMVTLMEKISAWKQGTGC